MHLHELARHFRIRSDKNTSSKSPFPHEPSRQVNPNGNDLAYQKLFGNHIRPYSISFLYLNRFGVISPKRFFLFSSYSV